MTFNEKGSIIITYYGVECGFGVGIMNCFVENYENMSDIQLISNIKNGKYEFLTVLVNRYIYVVDFFCNKYGLAFVRDDIVQDVTFSIYSSINSFDETKSSFATFANTIIKRVIISYIKKSNRKKDIPEELLQPLDNIQVPDFNSPEKILLDKEQFKDFTDNIKLELSNLEFKVLNLFLSGLSYEDIADKLGIAPKAVDNALSRIRKKLK